MKKFLITLLIPITATAANPFKLKDFYFEVERAYGSNTTLELGRLETRKKKPEYRVGNANIGFELENRFTYDLSMYSNTKIESIFTQKQFRYVALDSEVGVTYDFISFYFRHYSGHTLDVVGYRNFPQANSLGVRIKLGGY